MSSSFASVTFNILATMWGTRAHHQGCVRIPAPPLNLWITLTTESHLCNLNILIYEMHTGPTWMIVRILPVYSCAMPSLTWQFGLILLLTMSFSPSSNHLHHLMVAPSLPSCRHHCHGVIHTPCITIPSAMTATPRHPTSRSPYCPHSATSPHLRRWPITRHEHSSTLGVTGIIGSLDPDLP